jgi:hypothetical protein
MVHIFSPNLNGVSKKEIEEVLCLAADMLCYLSRVGMDK